jgi:hypothetical protein
VFSVPLLVTLFNKSHYRSTEFTEDALRVSYWEGKRLPAWLAIAAATAAAVATATAAITTVTTAAAATTATAAAKATTATAAAIFARLGFVNVQRPTVDFLTVKLSDSCLALFLAGHFDKAKAA